MEIVKLVLERLLIWQIIVPALILVVFRVPVIALLNRVRAVKAGREGFSLDANAAAVQQPETKQVEAGLSGGEAEERLAQVRDVALSPAVQKRERWIREDLRKMNLDAGKKETVDLLIRHLAVTQADAQAEQAYRQIFGSQIAALKILNSQSAPVEVGGLQAIYNVAASNNPEAYANFPFETWLRFLVSKQLITGTAEGILISTDGREFLKWITDAGLPENKPF